MKLQYQISKVNIYVLQLVYQCSQLESTIGIFNVECYFLVKVYIYMYDVYSLLKKIVYSIVI